ncbi:MAG: PEGA domain-containing protein [Myxococcales bacterium]|nr:PEGA domain-containing protein [Myxococcales bacterium]
MRKLSRWTAASLAILLFASSPSALAGDEGRDQSRAAFRRGVTAAKENNYVAAREAFVEAYRLFPHPSILLNLGIARARTGELVDAEQDLVRFIADDGGATADEVKSAQKTLTEVREKLGTLALEVKPAGARATLDGKSIALLVARPTLVRAAPGPHKLRVEADDHEPTEQAVEVVSRIETPISVELVAHAKPQDPSASTGGINRSTLGFGLLGGSVLLAGAGTFLGLRAMALADTYNNVQDPQQPSTKTTGVLYRTFADVAFVGAVACGAAGAYFLLVKPKPAGAQAGLVISPQQASFVGAF